MKVLGIIPARRGSKGITNKNAKLLGDKPLLQYSAESALLAKSISKTILSTDSEKNAEIGKRCGLEVPFLRPDNLAQDTTPTLSVILHAIEYLEKQHEYFDAICLLDTLSPRANLLVDEISFC